MPQNKKSSTLLRQWEMMRMLTVSRSDSKQDGRWDKASEIAARLVERGYQAHVRTVQRDLKELSEIFPIELNDKNPRDYGWRWRKGAGLDIQGISVSEALAMRLVEAQLKPLLPATMLDGLQGVFGAAQARLAQLEQENNNHSGAWLDKIRVVAPTQPLLPPVVDQAMQSNIYQALLENRQLAASYRPSGSDQIKEYVLHPLGLIMRGAVTYLVATAWDYTDVRLYALHRFTHADVRLEPVSPPEGFDLDRAIAGGLAGFAHQGAPIRLEIRCTESVAAYLTETPLAADQTKTPETDGWIRLTATVNDTWQLRWWLLGQGAGVEICAPLSLRTEVKQTLADAAMLYTFRDDAQAGLDPGFAGTMT